MSLGQPPAPLDVVALSDAETVVDRLSRLAAEHPTRPAVRCGAEALSYRRLAEDVRRWAAAIDASAGLSDGPIGVYASVDASFVTALMAVLTIGRPYLFLDPRFPPARLLELVRTFRLAAVVCAPGTPNGAWASMAGVPWIHPDEAQAPREQSSPRTPRPGDPACITITSGSTGRPAGVAVSHRSLLFNVLSYGRRLGIRPDDRISLLASPAFAAATTDIFTALAHGACLLPFDIQRDGLVALGQWLDRERISVLHTVPTLFRHLARRLGDGGALPALRWIKLGGETVHPADLTLYQRRFAANTGLLSGLGISEAAGNVAYFQFGGDDPIPTEAVPVGRPVPGREVLVVDSDGRPVDTGDVGEIVVRSAFLADGYWQDEDRTRARFTPLDDGRVQLATRDRGRFDAAGNLWHLGRLDDVVKIAGHRVDPAAIEAVLLRVGGVRQAAVVVRPAPVLEGDAPPHQLVACVELESDVVTLADLRRALTQRLPGYLVPGRFEQYDALPLTPGGKLDRRSLRAGDPTAATLGLEPVAPDARALRRSGPARDLADIWAELLGSEAGDPSANFFEQGGTSVLALELLARLNETLGVDLAPRDFVADPTLGGLARRIAPGTTRPSATDWLVPFGGGEGPLRVVVVPGGIGSDENLVPFSRLFAAWAQPPPAVGVRLARLVASGAGERGLPALVEPIAAELRAVAPTGRLNLVGECLSGPVAIELARRLHAEGREVTLTVLDPLSIRPSHWRRFWASPVFEPMAWAADRRAATGTPIGPGDSPLEAVEQRQRAVRAGFPRLVRRVWRAAHPVRRLEPLLAGVRLAFDYSPRERRYRRDLIRFRPDPCGWPIHLIVTDESAPEVEFWREVARAGLTVHTLPGPHGTALRRQAARAAAILATIVQS